MPAHSETNGIGAQIPTEKYGVMSPFHAGGGGGGGGGGGAGAATQLFDGASNTVPGPHSAAVATPTVTVMNASGASTQAPTVPTRRHIRLIEGLPRSDTPTFLTQMLVLVFAHGFTIDVRDKSFELRGLHV